MHHLEGALAVCTVLILNERITPALLRLGVTNKAKTANLPQSAKLLAQGLLCRVKV